MLAHRCPLTTFMKWFMLETAAQARMTQHMVEIHEQRSNDTKTLFVTKSTTEIKQIIRR
jgi:hypothetical protein